MCETHGEESSSYLTAGAGQELPRLNDIALVGSKESMLDESIPSILNRRCKSFHHVSVLHIYRTLLHANITQSSKTKSTMSRLRRFAPPSKSAIAAMGINSSSSSGLYEP